MKIRITAEVSDEQYKETITLADLGHDEESWAELSENKQRDEIISYLDSVNQPYWRLQNFTQE